MPAIDGRENNNDLRSFSLPRGNGAVMAPVSLRILGRTSTPAFADRIGRWHSACPGEGEFGHVGTQAEALRHRWRGHVRDGECL